MNCVTQFKSSTVLCAGWGWGVEELEEGGLLLAGAGRGAHLLMMATSAMSPTRAQLARLSSRRHAATDESVTARTPASLTLRARVRDQTTSYIVSVCCAVLCCAKRPLD